ncbi:MAG: peptide MFS transporter, partial [Bacteroidia bacterium]|nr:peptide MFS transporter [Bacteroidia bacterium]
MLNSGSEKHPSGLYLLFFTEMWERFSYYGMRAIFTLYLVNALMIDKKVASEDYYGSYTGLVYLTPLIGGYVSDRFWGNRRSILFGGIMMAIGQFCMFLSASYYQDVEFAKLLMLGGLTSLIIGNGFFKPNISTMVGQLYVEGDKRRDAAYTIFYMGINLGAFLSPLVCGTLGEKYDVAGKPLPEYFKWGFLAACIGMIISIISFELFKNNFLVTPEGLPIGGVPDKKKPSAQTEITTKPQENSRIFIWLAIALAGVVTLWKVVGLDFIGSFIYTLTIVAPAYIILDPSLTKIERDRIIVIYVSAFFVIFFWAAFEQAGASLTFFAAEQTDRNIGSWEMPASIFNSFNAIFIVFLAPLFSLIWQVLGKNNIEPSSPAKQAWGLLFLSLGYLVIAFGVKDLDPSIKVSMMWLTTLYLLHTIGELCLSPIGLSMVNKLAPVRFASLLMGVWFLSTSAANKFAGVVSGLYPDEKLIQKGQIPSIFGFQITNLYEFFMVFVVMSGI